MGTLNAWLVVVTIFSIPGWWWLVEETGHVGMDTAFVTGFILILLVLLTFLVAKKSRFRQGRFIQPSKTLTLHVFLGGQFTWLVMLHVGNKIPQGTLEVWLASLVVLIIFTGFVGWRIQSRLPEKIAIINAQTNLILKPQLRDSLLATLENKLFYNNNTALKVFYDEFIQEMADRPKWSWNFICPFERAEHALLEIKKKEHLDNQFFQEVQNLIYQLRLLYRLWRYQHLVRYWSLLHLPLVIISAFLLLWHIAQVWGMLGHL